MDIKDYWNQPSFETRVVTNAARPPKGGQLVASIIHEIYGCWKNIPNAPIRQPTEARVAPFHDILHTIQPALLPGAALTPFKVGLVYCWMLRSVWLAQTWPGHITASVYNAQEKGKLGLPLGVVYVENSPQRIATRLTTPNGNTIMSSFSPNVTIRVVTNASSDTNDLLSVLQDQPIPEKSWLECFSMIMFVIFRHPWSDRVTDTYPPGRHIFHWVSTLEKRIEGTLAIYYEAGAAFTNQLTFDHLAKATLSLGNEAAAAGSWDGKVQVSIDAKLVAQIWIGRAEAADDSTVAA